MSVPVAPKPDLLVVAAVIVSGGRVLLTRRNAGAHLAGHWEFPGGKVEPGETPPEALRRELAEELGVASVIAEPFAFNHHVYPDRNVLLLTYRARLEGEPRPLGCAALDWFAPEQVRALTMPPADAPILTRLLPLLERGEAPTSA
jgi:8-oxo-dGTP diphosphatase